MPGKVKKTDTVPATKPSVRRTRLALPAASPPELPAGTAPASPVRRKRATAASPSAPEKPRTTARRASVRRQTAGSEPMAVVADRETIGRQAVPAVPAEPTHAEIAELAYFIYLERNGAPGDPGADWAQAEYELRRRRGLI